ncbi:glutathione synthetase, chloroplastic [Cynara cardunculus var. scolymus]|uniref:glutathione synthetase, chloroplastic n=1 Tax=Cynara cardunculus var. scolymus TaxID=59895 RepID=UPI000D6314B9|nr:glutathione synthetase, chloroplastic [Cynara cardunculus var. scolymus]
MVAGCSSWSSISLSLPHHHCCFSSTLQLHHLKSASNSLLTPSTRLSYANSYFPKFSMSPLKSGTGSTEEIKTTQDKSSVKNLMSDFHAIDSELLQKLVYDALVWSSLHGLVVGDRNSQRSGLMPGVGMVHAPFALLPNSLPESHWKQACELAPIFNELVDRVSLDGKFLQDTLSRTKKVDAFTSRILDIHSRMLQIGKKEDIRLGLHRSDYMLDEKTNLLLQIELNTISCSFSGLSCRVSELHRSLLSQYREHLGFDPERIPINTSASNFAKALAKAWTEYNNPSAIVLVVVQPEERNMYDQHWLSATLKEKYNITSIRKTLAEIDAQGKILSDGTLQVDGETVAVVYFRAGYAPTDYPSESEWRARLLMEESSAIKCPSIAYHLTGTKKIQQELAKPNILERFLDNKDDIAKLRACFAGLWSLDDSNAVKNAIEQPGAYVMKPQREGGGNNIYGDDVRETLVRLQKEGSEEEAAYILMQRIFPTAFRTILVRDGICYKEHAISELGIFSAYLRNKEKVISNEQCGYLMRTKVSSSNEGGVAAGFAVLDSLYLT